MDPLAATESKSSLLTLPNELMCQVASNLESFQDLNSLVRTSSFFHTLFNTHLYRRAVAANDHVRESILLWLIYRYRVTSLVLLLDNGLSVHQELSPRSRVHSYRRMRMRTNTLHLLHWVCRSNDHERSVPLARLLLERGAHMETKDVVWGTPSGTVLHIAAQQGNCPIAALLLAHGADANLSNRFGRTPLHLAVNLLTNGLPLINPAIILKNGLSMMKLLLDSGADVNATTKAGETPLHGACSSSGLKVGISVVQFLLENGADVNPISEDVPRPLELASRAGRHDVVALLKAHGAEAHKRLDWVEISMEKVKVEDP
jgi:hypothetical protein